MEAQVADYKKDLDRVKTIHSKLQELLHMGCYNRTNACTQAVNKIKEANFWIEENIKYFEDLIKRKSKN